MEDFGSYKVADLRRELKIRGLAVTGTKGELLSRLQLALSSVQPSKPTFDDSAMDDALLDEDSVLGEDDDDESPGDVESSDDDTNASHPIDPNSVLLSPTEKKVLDLSPTKKQTVTKGVLPPASIAKVSTIPPSVKSPEKKRNGAPEGGIEGEIQAKKAKITINRQPVQPPVAAKTVAISPTKPKTTAAPIVRTNSVTAPGETAAVKIVSSLSSADRAKLRQEKFGVTAATETKASKGGTIAADPPAKLKQRAERFGSATVTTAGGKVSLTTDEEARLAKRRERFAAQLNDAKPTAVDITNRKVKRAERFGIVDTKVSKDPGVV